MFTAESVDRTGAVVCEQSRAAVMDLICVGFIRRCCVHKIMIICAAANLVVEQVVLMVT